DEAMVGIELLLDRVRLEDALDAQHLLHLVLHRQLVLERPGGVRPEREVAVALVLEHLDAEFLARRRVLLEAHEIFAGERHIPYAIRSSFSGCVGSRGVSRLDSIWWPA